MKIKIKSFANFRKSLGKDLEIDIPEGETIRFLLDDLCDSYRELRKDIFDTEGNVKPYLNIFKNGIDIRSLDKLETKIKKGDVIAFIPPFAGG